MFKAKKMLEVLQQNWFSKTLVSISFVLSWPPDTNIVFTFRWACFIFELGLETLYHPSILLLLVCTCDQMIFKC